MPDDQKTLVIPKAAFGQKLGLIARFFGCRHKNLSRPFSSGRAGYRSCLDCGARKQFDPETLQTYGSFYFPPSLIEKRT